MKNKDKDDRSSIGASIFGGLNSDDIIWEENGREVGKNTGTKRKTPTTPTVASQAKRSNQGSSDIDYITSDEPQRGIKVPCALMDIRFLPGRVGNEPLTEAMLKNIYDAFRKSRFSELLNLPQMWTFIGNLEDTKVLKCSLGSIFLDKGGFIMKQAYYVPHFDEEIGSDGSNFFDGSHLILLHVYWPEENETEDATLPKTQGSCAMKQFHIAEKTPRYMFPQVVRSEQEHALFKEELRFQSYMDIIAPMSIPHATFLNICGGNKPHLVASLHSTTEK